MREAATYIWGVTDELTKKDLLVAVEGVDYQTEELIDLSLEGKRLGLRHRCNSLREKKGCEMNTKRARVVVEESLWKNWGEKASKREVI